jgi:hypothetical protein
MPLPPSLEMHEILEKLAEDYVSKKPNATLQNLSDKVFAANQSLINVLRIINEYKNKTPNQQGISTRDLLRAAKTHSAHKYLTQGEMLGLIKRETLRVLGGRGGGRARARFSSGN